MPLEFTEYAIARPKDGRYAQVPPAIENATQSIAIGGASVQSAAFGVNTDMVVISKVDAACRIASGPPTANNGNGPLAVTTGVGQTRYLDAGSRYAFRVNPGDKLAVIQA